MIHHYLIRYFLLSLLVIALASCAIPNSISPAQQERERIFMLTAYSAALKNWQDNPAAITSRGYNVASILVDDDKIIAYGLNRDKQKKQALYHAEMDMAITYLARASAKAKTPADLYGMSVYTTLEPCLMCYGTLRELHARQVIYGQHYAHGADELLDNDSRAKNLRLREGPADFVAATDEAYAQDESEIKAKTVAPNARGGHEKAIYQKAYCGLLSYQPTFAENESIARNARKFLTQMPGKFNFCP